MKAIFINGSPRKNKNTAHPQAAPMCDHLYDELLRGADGAAISAKVEDGILTIELPKIKREEGKTGRQIAIS